jgi:hypothetical protein
MGHTACTEPQCLYKGALYLFNRMLLIRTFVCYGHFRFYTDSYVYTSFGGEIKAESINEMQKDINICGTYLITLLVSGPVASF